MASTQDDFVQALKKIRESADLSHKFMKDPHGTLKSLGVEVGKQATSAPGAVAPLGICIGACVCVG